MYNYNVELIRVIDGDTVVVDIDLGFSLTKRKCHVRLLDVEAPEVRGAEKVEGLVVKSKTIDLFESYKGQQLELQSIKLDSFGRALGILSYGAVNINEEINKIIRGE